MAGDLTDSIAALRRALDLVLDAVVQRNGDTVVLDADHYWVLPPELAYAVDLPPDTGSMTLGQLSDDVDELTGMLDDGDRVSEPWHDLAHLTGILQRIAARDRPRGGDERVT